MKKRFVALLLVLIMVLGLLPVSAFAADDGVDTHASTSTVVLHPSVNNTVTGVKVKVGDRIDGHPVTSISGYDITVDLGKYNVNNDTFRLPYAKDIWEGVDNNKVDYISWAGSGSNRRSEGASALLANGKNTAYYYFKGEPVLPTFTLNYDANGGTGAPASQTYKATSQYENSHTFTISTQVPTREGFTFLGWSTNRNATTAERQPGGSIVVTGTTTLYAVWKENTPPVPDRPLPPTKDDIRSNLWVTVVCTTNRPPHEKLAIALFAGDYTIADTVKGDAASGYTCEVTVQADRYIVEYGKGRYVENGTDLYYGSHRLVAGEPSSKVLTLIYANGTWTIPANGEVNFNVECDNTPPSEIPGDQKPEFEKENAKIRVQCVEYPSKHNPYTKTYRILPDSYTDLGWDRTEYGYIYSIRLNRAKYIEQFDQDIGRAHTDTEPNKETRIEWRWENGAWHLIDGPDGVTADIKVKCSQTPVEPAKPTELDGSFAIVCKNNEATHGHKADYIATPRQYTISDVQMDGQGYYVTATVTVAPNLAAYNTTTGAEHRLVNEQDATLIITFRYNTEVTGDENRKWQQQGEMPVVEVKCAEKFPVHVMIFRNGDTSKAYKTVALEQQPKGHVIDLNELKIGDYYTGTYDFYGWYDDGLWNIYKANVAAGKDAPKGMSKKTVNGHTNIKCMVYDYEKVVYFKTYEDWDTYQKQKDEDRDPNLILHSTFARYGDELPTADAPTEMTLEGHTFEYWSREGQHQNVTGQTVNGWTNLYGVWAPKNDVTYKVKYVLASDHDVELKAAKVVTDGEFDSTVTEQAETITGYSPDAESKNLTLNSYDEAANVITFYYTPKNDVTYKVKYVLASDHDVELKETKVVTEQVFDSTVTENAEAITGYSPDAESKNLTLNSYDEAANVITFYYTPNNYSYLIEYYKQVDTKDGSVAYVLAETETVKNAPFASTVTINLADAKYQNRYIAEHYYVDASNVNNVLTGVVGADNKTPVLKVYYNLDFHTLTFDTMGGSKIAPETVRHGLTVARPRDPVNAGYIFDGWYTDKTFRYRYNFATPLTEDITIYAKWVWMVLPGTTVKKNTPKLNTADHFAYVQGYPDGTVKPTGNITRAETAAILFRLMDDSTRNTYYSTRSGFRDVALGSWYNTYVATLNNAGVITDSANGNFRPNEAITRAELAAMLANFTDTAGAANYFNDVSAKYWAANAIAICAKLGWINGYPDGSFRPDRNVTRAELMAMINRATGRAPKSADAFLTGMKTWKDNTADKWYYLDVQEATNSHSYTVKNSEVWTALNAAPNWSKYE